MARREGIGPGGAVRFIPSPERIDGKQIRLLVLYTILVPLASSLPRRGGRGEDDSADPTDPRALRLPRLAVAVAEVSAQNLAGSFD